MVSSFTCLSRRQGIISILVIFMLISSFFLYCGQTRLWKTFATVGKLMYFEDAKRNGTQFDQGIATTLKEISDIVKLDKVDCLSLFNGSENELISARIHVFNISTPISDEAYINLTSNCVEFQTNRGYIMSPLTKEEENFPLAFSILVYKEAEMVERLLRSIYRPQNFYCIHVDRKSSDTFFKAMSLISICFGNVFIASTRISVIWGQFSVLESELVCMKDLWKYSKWKYFINLTGQEFPLKTNYEFVKILMAFKGANDIASTVKRANKERWKNTTPPHQIRPAKGSVHIAANRDFIDYILHNKTAQDLLEWTKGTRIPDEAFFATLNANPQLGIKGTYTGEPEMSTNRSYIVRFKNWGASPCAGRRVRGICILTTGDLPLLIQSRSMVANKFHLSEDRVVIGCLEEKIFNDTRDEYIGTKTFNYSYYENLHFVKNRVF